MTEEPGAVRADEPDWSPPGLGLSPLSRVRLDELLQELLSRIGDVVTSRERLRLLLGAVVAIGTDLELHSTLERIVRSACELAGARYGALGIIGPDRMLEDFITHGIDPETHAAIGDLPRGHGVLGLLIDDPRPIRLPDITRHERAYGFPPRHPVMHTFLGVPIRIRDQVFGNLYLAEKRGGGQFTDDDEELVTALSFAAGAAIENARLYAQTQLRQRWLEATAEITGTLLAEDLHPTAALQLVADRALELAGGQLAMVLLVDGDTLTVEVASGTHADAFVGATVQVTGSQLESLRGTRHTTVLEDLDRAASWPVSLDTGVCLLVPLTAAGSTLGALLVAYPSGMAARTAEPDLALVETFAGQAALALEQARAQQEREELAILGDRERIARDLHDVVIQRLFAAGTQLVGTSRMAIKPEVAKRIDAVVDDLDATIRDIRGAIFQLRTPVAGQLRGDLRGLVAEAEKTLGFRPQLILDGPVDSAVPEDVRPALLAVLREALSNVARHARAGKVTVTVTTAAGQLALRVQDDGVGITDPAGSSGIVNMRRRAEELGGRLEIGPAGAGGGAVVEWRVPL